MPTMFRQGDVLLVKYDLDMADVKKRQHQQPLVKVDKEEGRVVLAHGEVTGHHHAFNPHSQVTMFREDGSGSGLFSRFGGGSASQPRHGVESIPRARDGSINPAQRRFIEVDGDVALLEHDEHGTIEVPKGFYEVIIQREYSPEAIRRVED